MAVTSDCRYSAVALAIFHQRFRPLCHIADDRRAIVVMKAKAPKKRATVRQSKVLDKEQYERFRQAARELGTDESEEAFERAFKNIIKPKERQQD